jgi:hypothetical protein
VLTEDLPKIDIIFLRLSKALVKTVFFLLAYIKVVPRLEEKKEDEIKVSNLQ